MKQGSYIYIAVVALLISSFPLALGWLPWGAYLPRLLFVLYSLFCYPFVLSTKPFILLCLYYLYMAVAYSVSGSLIDWVGFSANFMEMGIPIIVMTILLRENESKSFEVMGAFSIIMTFITIVASLYVLLFIDPTAIRALVGMMSRGESIIPYLRLGVADYSTAAMIMAMPCFLIGFYKNIYNRRIKNLCLLGILVAIWFMYQASVTTTFFICIIISLASLFVNDKRGLKRNILTIFPIVILLLAIVLPFALDYLSNVLNEDVASRSAMLNDFWSGSSYDESEDLGTRIVLYRRSIDVFLENPLFGNASAMVGGHAYLLDRLGLFGLIGTLLHLSFVYVQCKMSYRIIPDSFKIYYLIIILGVVVLAFLKNLSGFDYWTFIFLYYPCAMFWGNRQIEKRF